MVRGIVIKPGDIFRDIGVMVTALDVRGGGGSPKELRSDAGIFIQYSIEETLKRHPELIEQDVSVNSGAVGAANTVGTLAFSFPEDHYLQAIEFSSVANAANLDYGLLELIPQVQTDRIKVAFTQIGDRVTFTGAPSTDDDYFEPHVPGGILPLFVRAATDYIFTLRSGAGGALSLQITIFRTQAPQGVEIAH